MEKKIVTPLIQTIVIEKEMKHYFDNEVRDLKNLIKRKPHWFDLTESKTKALDRCYGVQEFAQHLGLDFETIDIEYTKLREEIDALGVDN